MNSIYNRNNSFVSITAFYALLLQEFQMVTHTHSSCEIMYVTDGSCQIWCDGVVFCLTKNQFIFIDASIPHRLDIIPGHPCSILNLEFCCQESKSEISLLELSKKSCTLDDFYQKQMPYFVSNDIRNLGYALKDLISQLQRNEKNSEYLICLLFYRTLLELSYCANDNQKTTGISYLKRACEYIDKHLYDTIRVSDIASYTGINRSYLQSLYSQILNCTITEYINQKRLEQAVFLLINSNMRITDIAFSTGYNSRQHFAHTFEKYYKISPLKYRKLHSKDLLTSTGNSQYHLSQQGIIPKNLF